jgi:tetratricopeptide (TPR) repeat protein
MSDYQTFLAQLQACEHQDERDRLSLNFSLSRLPEVLRAAVQAAAVPRFFDRAFLNALLDQSLDEAQFAELTGLSYIEPYPGEGRFNVHERSRKLLQEKLWQEDEALYREISRRALQHCVKQDQDDTTWRIETVYHRLIAEPDDGVRTFKKTCSKWMNPPLFAHEKAESLLCAVREHIETNRLSGQAGHYFWLWQARVDMYCSRFKEAMQSLQRIPLASIKDNLSLTASCLKAIAHIHRYLSELNEARLCYEEAIILYQKRNDRQNNAECLLRLGEVYLRLSKFSEAKRYDKEAFILYRKISNSLGKADCLKSLGHVHLHLAEYSTARLLYEKALTFYRAKGAQLGEADCLRTLGDVHRSLAEYPEAQLRCEEALQLYRRIYARLGEANSLKSLGQVHLRRSEFKEAQLLYEESLQIYRKIGLRMGEADCLRLFGDMSVQTGDLVAAPQYYKQALALSEDIQRPEGVAECWEGFAKLHQAQKQFPPAEECWQKAAAMYRQLAMPLREQHCLEQLRRMKEQNQAADMPRDC